MRSRQTRFITQQICEDIFNRIKKDVDLGSNTVCSAARAWAVPVDKKVVGKLHRFKEVDHTEVLHTRRAELEESTFHPPLRPDRLKKSIRELNLHRIAGYSDAGWFSPQAQGSCRPACEMIALRAARQENKVHLLPDLKFCQLISRRMLFRKVDSEHWFFSMGSVTSTLAIGWPAKAHQGPLAPNACLPCPLGKPAFLAVLDVSQWEAMPMKILSPMHQAVLKALPAAATPEEKTDSAHQGRHPRH